MGAEASKPKPRAKLQVIGAGLPRTGTASFSAAISILLNGPVYHGGTQNFVSDDESHVKSWIKILSRTPYKSPEDKSFVMKELRALVDGYVCTVDSPLGQFVPELMELYPDAKVICTVRDPDAWANSIDETANNSLQSMLGFILFWVPCLRYLPRYLALIQSGRWGELYARPGEKNQYGRVVWDRHLAYLERSVPNEKLIFFDVKEGWEPLCKALNVPVPKDVEFPRINDGNAIDEFAKRQVTKGLMRWAAVAGLVATAVAGIRWLPAIRT